MGQASLTPHRWGTGLENGLQDRLDIAPDFIIRKSLNTIPTFLQPGSPSRVIFRLVCMTIPVEFNNMLSPSADKINNVRAKRVLAAKAQAAQLMITQPRPQFLLGGGRVKAQSLRSVKDGWRRTPVGHGYTQNQKT